MKPGIKNFFLQSAIYTTADGVVKAGNLLLLPIYTRLLTPSDYGLLGLVGTISTLAITIISLGTRGAIHRYYFKFDDDDNRGYFYGTLWIFLIIVPALGIIVIGYVINKFFNNQFYGITYTPFLSLGIWSHYFNLSFITFLILVLKASGKAFESSVYSFLNFLIPSCLAIACLYYYNYGAESVLWGKLIGAIIVSALTVKKLLKHIRFDFRFKKLPPALLYSIPLIFHFLSNWILASSDQLIIKYFFSLSEVGIYNFGYLIGSVPVYVAASIYTALLPLYGHIDRSSFLQMTELTRLITYYVMVTTILVLIVAMFSNEIVTMIAPVTYRNAGQFLPWISLGSLFTALYYLPAATLTHIIGKSKYLALGTLLAGTSNITLNLIFVPIGGAYAAAVTTAVSYFILFAFTYRISVWKFSLPYEMKRFFKIVTIAMALFIISKYTLCDSLWLQISLKLLLILFFPLSLYLLDFFTDDELRFLAIFKRKLFRLTGE